MVDTLSADMAELLWLAGFLEGEGSFVAGPPSKPNLPIIRVSTTDRDVCEHAARLLGVSVVPIRSARYAIRGWKQPFQAVVKGRRAVDLMLQLRPFMGSRRRQQIDAAIASYRVESTILSKDKRVEIVRLCRSGMRQSDVAKRFGICRETVSRVYCASKMT